MLLCKQEERDLKRVEGDIVKKESNLRKALKNYENSKSKMAIGYYSIAIWVPIQQKNDCLQSYIWALFWCLLILIIKATFSNSSTLYISIWVYILFCVLDVYQNQRQQENMASVAAKEEEKIKQQFHIEDEKVLIITTLSKKFYSTS